MQIQLNNGQYQTKAEVANRELSSGARRVRFFLDSNNNRFEIRDPVQGI